MKIFDKIIEKYHHWKVKKGLKKTHQLYLERDKILENWTTKRILEGHQHLRKDLIDLQMRCKEYKLFLEFLKKSKI